MPLATLATAALLALHLAADRRGWGAARAVGKVGASLAFVAFGVATGADDPFRAAVVAGLVLSAAGDALLLSSAELPFLAGLVAFLSAHVAYAVALARLSRPSWAAAAAMAAATLAVLAWLWPHAGRLRGPVLAYCAVIGAMVTFALGTARPDLWAAAALFWLSDVTVARDRFVRPGFANRLVGLPLYYAAQLLFAGAAG